MDIAVPTFVPSDTVGGSAGESGGSAAEPGGARGRATAARRRARQREIVASTRQLFDARGMRSANIDDISRAVGINRAIIYRHFASKEELFALTLAEYLTELDGLLSEVDKPEAAARDRFAVVTREFATYCLRYPAFVDCALALLGRPGPDLLEEISDSALLRLGGLMGAQLHRIASILKQGHRDDAERAGEQGEGEQGEGEQGEGEQGEGEQGERAGEGDADVLANALYLQVLGVMHLARSGVVLRPAQDGQVSWMMVSREQIIDLVTRMAVAVAFPGSPR